MGLKNKKKDRASVFHPGFREDLNYWVKADRSITMKTFDLIEAMIRDPFNGIGKLETLKYVDSGRWSRRLTQEHRIVYLVRDPKIDFLQVRYHY